MRLALAVLLVTAVAGYGPSIHSKPATGGCGSGGSGCGGIAPGGGGGDLPIGVIRSQPSQGGNRRVANIGGGGYWWQSNNPFVGAGSRAPSSGGGNVVVVGGGGGGGKFPASGGGGGGSFPGSRPTKFPLGGSSFPGSLQPIDNSIVGPMGICPPEFVCVHWQLCRNGQVILDGTGIIDKSKRRPAGQYDNLQGCGGDMICCGVTPGYTVPGVISTLTSQLPGSSETVQASVGSNTPLHSSTHLSSVGTLSVNAPASDLHPGSAVPQRNSGFSSVGSAKPAPDEPTAVHTALPASSLSASPPFHSSISSQAGSVSSPGHELSDAYPTSAGSTTKLTGSVTHFDSSSDSNKPSPLSFSQTLTTQSSSNSKISSSQASHSTLHSSSQSLPAGSSNTQTSSQLDLSSLPTNHDLSAKPLVNDKQTSSHIDQSPSSGIQPHPDSKFESKQSIAVNVPNLHSAYPTLPADSSTSIGVPSLPGLYEPPVNDDTSLSQNDVSQSSSDSSSISSAHKITSPGVHSGTSDFVSDSHATSLTGIQNVPFTDSATSSGSHGSTAILGGQSTSVNKQHINQVSPQNPSVSAKIDQTVPTESSFVDSVIPEEYIPPTTSLDQGSSFTSVHLGEKLPCTSQSKPNASESTVICDQSIHHSSTKVESLSSNLDASSIVESLSTTGTQDTQTSGISIISSNIPESEEHSVSQTYPQSDSSLTPDKNSGSAFGSNLPANAIPTLAGGYLPPDRESPSVHIQQSSAGKTASNGKPNFLDHGHLIASLSEAFGQSSTTNSGASGTQGTLHPTPVIGGHEGVSNQNHGGIPIVFNENVSPSGGSFGVVAPNDVRAPSAGLPKPSHGGNFGSGAGSKKPFLAGAGSGSSGGSYAQPGSSSGSFPKPETPGGSFNQPGCAGGSVGGCNQPGSFPQPSPGSSYPQPGDTGGPVGQLGSAGGSFPTSGSGGFNKKVTPGGTFPRPGSSGSFPDQLGSSSSGGSYSPPSTSGGNFNQPGSQGSGFNQPGSSGSGSYQPGSSGSGFNQPGSLGSGFNQPGSSGSGFNQPGSSGSGFNQPGSSGSGFNQPGSSGSGFNQPGSSGSGFNQPGSSGSGSFQKGSSGGGFNQPGASGSGSYQPGSSGSGFNQPGFPGFNQNNPGSPGSPGSQGYNQPGGNQGAPGSPGYKQPGQSGGGSNFPSGGYNQPSGGSLSQAGSSFPQKNVANPPMANMMGMMMGMGTPLIGGSCSAGTFCVPRFQCNPYNGFIIMDPAALQAVWPDSPQVPLLDCLIPAGVLDGGVCCQQMHPIVGPNGQVLD